MAAANTAPLALLRANYDESYGRCAPRTAYMAETSDIPLQQGVMLSQQRSATPNPMYACPPGSNCMTYNSRLNNTSQVDYVFQNPSRNMLDRYRPALVPGPNAFLMSENARALQYKEAGKCPPSMTGPFGVSNTIDWAQSTKIAQLPSFVGSQIERNLGSPFTQNMQDTFGMRAKITAHPRFTMTGISEREAMEMHNQAQYAEVCRASCECASSGDGLI